MACMARHANFSLRRKLFNGYGVTPGLEPRKRQRIAPVPPLSTDPRLQHDMTDLTMYDSPKIPLISTVAAPAANTFIDQAASPAAVPVPPPFVAQSNACH